MFTHLFFTAAFLIKAPLSFYDAVIFVLLLSVAAVIFRLRGVRLKRLNTAVIVYAVVLCAMNARALSMLITSQTGETFAVCVALGGTLFAVSDALLAMEKFGGRYAKAAGTISTFAYYAAQILIAFSVAL